MTSRSRETIYELPLKQFAPDCPWPKTTLGEVANVLGGGTPDTNAIEYWDPPEIPWATPTDITGTEGNEIRTTERYISTAGLKHSTLVPENSVLMTSRATIAAAKINRVPMAINQGFAALSPKEGYCTEYLFYLIELLRLTLVRLGAGTTFLEASRREIRKVQLRLPDLNEQKIITVALELADECITKAKLELDATKSMKRSLMAYVFERGLTPNDCLNTFIVHRSHTAQIPVNWWAEKLGQNLVRVEYGTNAPSNDYWGGYPVIAIPQVIAPHLKLADVPYAEVPEAEASALRLLADDVLLIRTNGNPDYIGKSTIVTKEVAAVHTIFASYLIRLRADKNKLLGPYLNYFLASPLGRRQTGAVANTSAGNNNIGARAIKQIRFPRPPIEEQERIVELLDGIEEQITAQSAVINSAIDVKRSLLHNLLTGKIRIPADAKIPTGGVS